MSGILESKKVVIAGGSGFVGVSLAWHLSGLGADVVILSRGVPRATGTWRHREWDGRTLSEWTSEINGSVAVVNLAGRSVDCIKTPEHRDEILRSRVESTLVLGKAMRSIDSPPPVWVQMSTAHIYGDPPKALCDEDSALGYGLAPDVGRAWEGAFLESVLPAQRPVILRAGFVLGRNRGAGMGALNRLMPLVRFGLGGRVGRGQQGMSWIHETDMNRLFERAITMPQMQGTYVASAPNPVSQVEFMRELRRVLGMPFGLPASSWMVRLGANLLLRTDPELALYGRYVHSKRLEQESFEFHWPTIREALQDVCSSKQVSGV